MKFFESIAGQLAWLFPLLLLVSHSAPLSAQTINISEELVLEELVDGIFMHSSDNNNGLVVLDGGEAAVVSTPATDEETQQLIDWLLIDRGARIVAFVADRWHPDAMGGLGVVHSNGIRSYANRRTKDIAIAKGLPIPEVAFDTTLELAVGSKTLVLDYKGKSHTSDGIVAWVRQDKVLFGGNGVRDRGGWIGNIGDASLSDWSNTISSVKQAYSDAVHVIPGHGKPGDVGLLDYTIELYSAFSERPSSAGAPLHVPDDFEGSMLIIESRSVKIEDGDQYFSDTTLMVRDASKILQVRAPTATVRQPSGTVYSESGELIIADRTESGALTRATVRYKDLYLIWVDDAVGLAAVVRELIE